MTKWAALFFAAAILVGVFGFGTAAPGGAAAAQITFVLCSIALLVALVLRSSEKAVLRPSRSNRTR